MSFLQNTSLTRVIVILVSAASLSACLIAPALFLLGRIDEKSYKSILLAGSVGWFLCASILAFGKGRVEAASKK